jgi:hypothetical protein
MNWTTLLAPFAWILNGILITAYVLIARWQTVLLLPLLAWLVLRGPAEHQRWSAGIAVLALLVSLAVPQPVPLLLLVMALSAGIAVISEKFNPANLHWRCISGIALYALLGTGILLFQAYLDTQTTVSPLLSQGQTYLHVLAAIGLYGIPLGYLVMLAQVVLVHPPIPGGSRPEQLIHSLRARKQD